jgi:hypothetical protein
MYRCAACDAPAAHQCVCVDEKSQPQEAHLVGEWVDPRNVVRQDGRIYIGSGEDVMEPA